MHKRFRPAWWAKSPHIQTILPVMTKIQQLPLKRQRLELVDGDFIDLDWLGSPQQGEPIVVLIHGLEGSANSHYIRRMLKLCADNKQVAVVHHHRSCSGEPNRLARSYHSGDTQDLAFVLDNLTRYYPNSPLLAVGYSLGGNVLTKYLGEHPMTSLIARAVVVSAPLKLAACAKKLTRGFSRIYQRHLIKQLQAKVTEKAADPDLSILMPVTAEQVKKLHSFHQFDDKVTAPLHGFNDVDDYYHRASGLPYLCRITSPTLVIHAKDDPFMNDDVIPTPHEVGTSVEYELHIHGGHVGFIEGGTPFKPKYYLEKRILEFLSGDQHADPL